MTRINVYLTDNQFQIITQLAEQAGVTFSEMLRRVLDEKFYNDPNLQNQTQ